MTSIAEKHVGRYSLYECNILLSRNRTWEIKGAIGAQNIFINFFFSDVQSRKKIIKIHHIPIPQSNFYQE